MRVLVKKSGNSAAVRIPASVMAAARLRLDQEVEVQEQHGRVVIDPVRPAEYGLAGPIVCCPATTRIKGCPLELPLSGQPTNVALADQADSFGWRARRTMRNGRVTSAELAEIHARLHGSIG